MKFFIQSSAQPDVQHDSVKQKYSCCVKIKTVTDDDISAALRSLTADSIFVAIVEDKFIKAGSAFIKILKKDGDTAIAINQISSLSIKHDPNIIYPDGLSKKRSALRRKNTGRMLGMVFSGIVTAPAVFFGSGPVIVDSKDFSTIGKKKTSVSGNTLHISKVYQVFQIDGSNEKYIEMVMQLTKSNTNPFVSVAKK